MKVLALDPGPTQSAYVFFDGSCANDFGIMSNDDMRELIIESTPKACMLAIEGVACYGMPVGAEVFQTCIWIGRFIEMFDGPSTLVYRKDVKLHLCGSMRAKDPMVRQALIDRFGPGKEKAIGRKQAPGPLYGISSHVWSALAVAVTYAEMFCKQRTTA